MQALGTMTETRSTKMQFEMTLRSSRHNPVRGKMLRVLLAVLLGNLLGACGFAQTPTLVQHISSGRDDTWGYSNPTYKFFLPNQTLPANCLVLRFDHDSSISPSSVKTDKGDTFAAGPSINTGGHVLETFYVGASAGSRVITLTTSGTVTSEDAASGDLSEFYNTSCTVDASGSSSSKSVSLSPTAANDLIWQSADDTSTLMPSISSMTVGSGFRMLQGNTSQGTFAQYKTGASAGSQLASFGTSDGDTWQSAAIAFKSAAIGTAPPATGMRIVNMYGETFGNSTHTMYVPCSGNLLVGIWSSTIVTISGATSSGGGAWSPGASSVTSTEEAAQVFYGQGMSCGSGMTVTPTYSVRGNGGTSFLVMMDVVGASSSAHDIDSANTGDQTSGSTVATNTITPTTANGLVVDSTSWWGCTAMSAPPGIYGGIATNSGNSNACAPTQTSPSTLNEDNGIAIYYNPSAAPVTFTYGVTGPVSQWAAVASAFKAATTTPSGSTVNPPTGLTAVAN